MSMGELYLYLFCPAGTNMVATVIMLNAINFEDVQTRALTAAVMSNQFVY